MTKLSNILVYEWRAWDGFLISHLVDAHCRLPARYDDTPESFAQVDWDAFDAVLFQNPLSDASGFPRERKRIIELFARKGLALLNDGYHDMTKSAVHRMLAQAGVPSAKATAGGDPDEWLFVKSNRNYGGEAERNFQEEYGPLEFYSCAHDALPRHNLYYREQRGRIDPRLWHDPSVVFERYIANAEDSFYRFYRFGAACVVVKGHSPALIKKICDHERDFNVYLSVSDIVMGTTPLPAPLQDVLARFLLGTRMEYFCLDIVHDMQTFYIIDLNFTPHSGNAAEAETEGASFLRQGMRDFARRRVSA